VRLVGAALASLCLCSAAGAATPGQAIAKLNAQRRANGIPGRIVENPAWSAACHLHNQYEERNSILTHPESRSKPGYTIQGNFAGTHAVLAQGSNWDGGNPWEYAPLHLAQLLAPGLARSGLDDWHGWVCATTFPGYSTTPPATNTVYTYPGNGTSFVYPAEVAAEEPFTPGDFVGLPQGTKTGPYLYVFAWGPYAAEYGKTRIAAASLSGPDGAVRLKSVDNTTPRLGPYLPQGSGILIPVTPLEPKTTYHASVTLSDGSTRLAHDWSFTTGTASAQSVAAGQNSVSYSISLTAGGILVVIESLAPNPTLTVQGPGQKPQIVPLTRSGTSYRSGAIPYVQGTTICVQSGGGPTGFALAKACKKI
jgi:hypothetical protein